MLFRSRRRSRRGAGSADPGRSGPFATEAVDPATLRDPRLAYAPHTDGDPDPGEVVWTWVPYEENDGRGKDRPTLVIARETSLTVYAVPLTSSSSPDSATDRADRISIGSGAWDARGRESVADVDRVLRVHHYGMRREATAVPRETYECVATELRSRYGWD